MESFFWRGLEKLEVVYCVGKVAKGRRWGWSGVVGSPGGEGWSGLDLLNTKQYTAKRDSAHTGPNVEKYGVIIKLPKSTVSSYETNIFLPAVIRKKKICWLQIFVNTLDLNPECFEKRKEKSLLYLGVILGQKNIFWMVLASRKNEDAAESNNFAS